MEARTMSKTGVAITVCGVLATIGVSAILAHTCDLHKDTRSSWANVIIFLIIGLLLWATSRRE